VLHRQVLAEVVGAERPGVHDWLPWMLTSFHAAIPGQGDGLAGRAGTSTILDRFMA